MDRKFSVKASSMAEKRDILKTLLKKLPCFVALATVLSSQSLLAQTSNEFGKGLSIRLVRVEQYDDRMPRIMGGDKVGSSRSVGRTVTLLDIEFSHCARLSPEDFTIVVKREGDVQMVQIQPLRSLSDCGNSSDRQSQKLSTSEIEARVPMVITNPALVDQLPPVY